MANATATEQAAAVQWLRIHGLTRMTALIIVEAMRVAQTAPRFQAEMGTFGLEALAKAFEEMSSAD